MSALLLSILSCPSSSASRSWSCHSSSACSAGVEEGRERGMHGEECMEASSVEHGLPGRKRPRGARRAPGRRASPCLRFSSLGCAHWPGPLLRPFLGPAWPLPADASFNPRRTHCIALSPQSPFASMRLAAGALLNGSSILGPRGPSLPMSCSSTPAKQGARRCVSQMLSATKGDSF
jgi:hypothetical protein